MEFAQYDCRDCFPQRITDTNNHADTVEHTFAYGVFYTERDTNGNTDVDADVDSDMDEYAFADLDTELDTDGFVDRDAHDDTDAYQHANRNADRNEHADPDQYAERDTDATAIVSGICGAGRWYQFAPRPERAFYPCNCIDARDDDGCVGYYPASA